MEIQHTDAVKTRYAHMRAAKVEVGDRVARGDQIGTVGTSGITTGPHVHYEVLVWGKQVDPLRFVIPQPVVATPTPAVTPAAAGSGRAAAAPSPGDSAAQPRVEQDSASVQREEAPASTP